MSASEPVGVDFGPVSSVPLPAGLRALLESLRPGRGPRHGTPSFPGTVAQLYQPRPRPVVREVLGFEVPGLSVLREAGQMELVATVAGAELVAAARSSGRTGGRGSVTVLYVPEEEVLQLSFEEAQVRGLSAVEVDYGDPWPPARPETMRSEASGDATMVDVRGWRVGVQYGRQRRTRLAWQQRLGAVECNVAVYLPHPPLQAVELLVRCDVLAAGG